MEATYIDIYARPLTQEEEIEEEEYEAWEQVNTK